MVMMISCYLGVVVMSGFLLWSQVAFHERGYTTQGMSEYNHDRSRLRELRLRALEGRGSSALPLPTALSLPATALVQAPEPLEVDSTTSGETPPFWECQVYLE